MQDNSSNVATKAPSFSEFLKITSHRIYGFWIYLMSDCIIFAVLFTNYVLLRNNLADGPSGNQIFELHSVLIETYCLLTSSFTCGLAIFSITQNKKNQVIFWILTTIFLGLAFLSLEIKEFHHLIEESNGPERSAFLSAFFTLVGTHGLHVSFGILWAIVMIFQIFAKQLTSNTQSRLLRWSLFWHLLDVIWIFIFTIVYLSGKI